MKQDIQVAEYEGALSQKVVDFLKDPEVKIMVLDTNVAIHDSKCFERFGKNLLVIPIWLMEELDKFKIALNGRGAAARASNHTLDKLFDKESPHEGILMDNGGMIITDIRGGDLAGLPAGMIENNDNRIVSVSLLWKKDFPEKKVVLVSKDVNLRTKAKSLEINAEDYRNDKKIESISQLYNGFIQIEVPDSGILQSIYSEGKISLDSVVPPGQIELLANQCCRLQDTPSGKYVLSIYRKSENILELADKPADYRRKSSNKRNEILPRNDEQALSYKLLMDPNINILTLEGKAGTGKTLLALKAAYEQLDTLYDRVIVYRMNREIGEKMGFMPGDLDEKFAPWKRPIIDSLKLIVGDTRYVKDGVKLNSLDDIVNVGGPISIEPINYIRGATLTRTFVICDDSQNLKPEEARALITRAGEGTKIVLTGDVYQIDDNYLDATSCGITAVIEGFKDYEDFGHIILVKGERSKLAEEAARRL